MTADEQTQLNQLHDALKARGKGCGDCTACCTIMRVDMPPVHQGYKPERVKCRYERKAGCSIYDDKPESCSSFMCLWLASQIFDPVMPNNWRPDRLGAVVDVNLHGVITVHLKHENAWRRPGPLLDMLYYLAQGRNPLNAERFVILDHPSGNHVLFDQWGRIHELVPTGIGPTGLKQYRTKLPGEQ